MAKQWQKAMVAHVVMLYNIMLGYTWGVNNFKDDNGANVTTWGRPSSLPVRNTIIVSTNILKRLRAVLYIKQLAMREGHL